MKKLMMLSAVAALLVGGSTFAADPNDPSVQIKAPTATYKMYMGQFDEFAHSYALDNGQQIRFTQSGKRYWARIKGEDRAELYPVAANVFLTAAGTRLTFRDQGDEVWIENYERLPMSVAMTEVNVRVVASR